MRRILPESFEYPYYLFMHGETVYQYPRLDFIVIPDGAGNASSVETIVTPFTHLHSEWNFSFASDYGRTTKDKIDIIAWLFVDSSDSYPYGGGAFVSGVTTATYEIIEDNTIVASHSVSGYGSENRILSLTTNTNYILTFDSKNELGYRIETQNNHDLFDVSPVTTIPWQTSYIWLDANWTGYANELPISTPEPGTMLLMGIGVAGAIFMRRRAKRS